MPMEANKSTKVVAPRSNVVKVLHWGDSPPSVVYLCGPSKYRAELSTAFRALTLGGHVVVMSGAFGPQDSGFINGETKKNLDELELKKIDMSDWLYVANTSGYIDADMQRQIDYAESLGKLIKYLCP